MKETTNDENLSRVITASNFLKIAKLSPERLEAVTKELIEKNQSKNPFDFLNDVMNWLVENGHMSSKYKNILLSPELSLEEAKQIKKLFKKEKETDKLELDEAIHWLDKGIEKYEEIEASQTMCDWCNAPATYSNEAYDLCENCSDQLHGI